jgi:hypothetical protein
LFMSFIYKSYSTGNVMGVQAVGGLAGANNVESETKYCYSVGSVNGSNHIGGLVGWNSQSFVSYCYSTGDVNGVSDVGGLVGWDAGGFITASFWDTDTQTHGVTTSIGYAYYSNVTNVAGLPTAQMQTRSTFTDADWDFIHTWNIGENQTYPYLRVYLAGDINKDGIVNFLDVAITANQWMQGVE